MRDDILQIDEIDLATARARRTGLRPAEFGWVFLGSLFLILFIGLGESGLLPSLIDTLVKALRLPLGFAYILFVPGYCFTAALFPGHDDLDGIEWAGLSIGLSIAWVPIIFLILDRLPWGLRLWPIAAGQLLAILIFSAIAIWRRSRLPAGRAYAPARWQPRPWWSSLPGQERHILQLCAAALLLAGLALAWVFLVPSPDEFMTEVFVLGADGLTEGYPRQTVPDQELMVTMGITNKERWPMTYRVEVWAVDPWSNRRQLVNTAGPIDLEKGESLEQPIEWQMPWAGDDQQVEFYLFAGGEETAEPYRQLRLWLNVVGE
jgi:uncharacterized membrane protein